VQEEPQEVASESAAVPSDAPIDPSTGGWEYRTGLSPEGRDRRLLVFVPHTTTPRREQHQHRAEEPRETLRELEPQGALALEAEPIDHDDRMEDTDVQHAEMPVEAAIAQEHSHAVAPQELGVPNATLPSPLLTSTPADAPAAAATEDADAEAYLTMEMDVTLGEVASHPGVDLDTADLLHEEVRGYESSDSQGRSWQDFGQDQEHELVEFSADGAFPELIPAGNDTSAGLPMDLTVDGDSGEVLKRGRGRPRRLSAERFIATLGSSPNADPDHPRRNVVSPSSSSAAPRSGSQRPARKSADKALPDVPIPSTLPASKRNSYQLLCSECKILQQSSDEKELTRAVGVIAASVVKRTLLFLFTA
jgi:hypothetical protein